MSTLASAPARPTTTPQPHSWLEDVQGFLIGSLLISLGTVMLVSNGQMTGGTAGIAFLLHYTTGLPIGPMFFLANLPFFLLAIWRMGWTFAIKSLLAVALLSQLIFLLPHFISFASIAPAYSALAGGMLIGTGALAFVRHGASIGGVNILAVYLQQRYNISAGKVQGGLDVAILICSIFVVDPLQLLYSVAGAVVVGAVLTLNHKPGRYMGF